MYLDVIFSRIIHLPIQGANQELGGENSKMFHNPEPRSLARNTVIIVILENLFSALHFFKINSDKLVNWKTPQL